MAYDKTHNFASVVWDIQEFIKANGIDPNFTKSLTPEELEKVKNRRLIHSLILTGSLHQLTKRQQRANSRMKVSLRFTTKLLGIGM